MKTLSMVLALVLLTVAVSAQQTDKKINSFPTVSVVDTTVVSQHSGQTQDQVFSDFADDLMEDEKVEETNYRSAALLLATIVGYVIYIFSINGK